MSTAGKLNRILTGVLLLAVLAAIAGVVYIVVAGPKTETAFTEFYLLGSGGKAYDYPKVIALGQQTTVTAGIVSHEREESNYTIRVSVAGVSLGEVGPMTLKPEEKWQNNVTFLMREAGAQQKVEFLLYKQLARGQDVPVRGDGSPYLSLHLFVDVVGKQATP